MILCDERYYVAVINGDSYEFSKKSDMYSFLERYRSEKGVINSLNMYKLKLYNLINK